MGFKSAFGSLLFTLFFFQGYSQSDSLPVQEKPDVKTDIGVVMHPDTTLSTPTKKSIYTLKPAVDIPIIAAGTIFTIFATTKIYTKGASTEDQINQLNIANINAFDRWAVQPYSKSLDEFSYYPFNASFAFPLVMFLVKDDTRRDFWKLTFLYWEALSITGLFGAGAPYFIDRYRPYAYSEETPMEQRVVQNAKNSAFSGHVEVIATTTFFVAKVYGDYFPESKWLMYGIASFATAGMAYVRIEGGMHFPSDVIIGAAIGTLSGILVPHFHKHKIIKDPGLSVLPFFRNDAKGFSLVYKL